MEMSVQVYFGLVILCSYLKPLVRLLFLCMCHAKYNSLPSMLRSLVTVVDISAVTAASLH